MANNLKSAPPGTIVNHKFVSSQYWDFLLVPAKPPENCLAIPTRFICIYDQNRLNDDNGKGEHDLMVITNGLCSLYFNWPGPTRVPAPVKYAMKIARQFCQSMMEKQPHTRLSKSLHFL